MTEDKLSIKSYASVDETATRTRLKSLLDQCPIPSEQLLANLGLFLESKNLARILAMDFLFRQIVDVPGVVMELGTRWGQNLALFAALRGIYEPFNRHRTIVGFDTFSGFPSISRQDGSSEMMQPGQLAVTADYARYLEEIIACHELVNPLSHLSKHSLRIGDSARELARYFEEAPHTVVALAYFDFDLYAPTKACLELIRPRLTRGSVVAFDEVNDPDSPGETIALMETFGLGQVRLRRFRHASRMSYFVVE